MHTKPDCKISEVFADGTVVSYSFPPSPRLKVDCTEVAPAMLTAPAVPASSGTTDWLHPIGAVYDSKLQFVTESRFREAQSLPPCLDQAPSAPAKLAGEWVFLGYYNEIYGHFILESLARLWAVDKLPDKPLNFVFLAIRNYVEYQGHYTEAFLEWAGLLERLRKYPGTRIEIIREPASVEHLTVPSRAFDIQGAISEEFRTFSLGLSRPFHRQGTPERLYLSRRLVKAGNHGFINETELEQVFTDLGFTIVNPENTPPEQQMELYAGARVMAGAMSSALHNSIYSHASDCHVIAINGRWPAAARRALAARQAPHGGNVQIDRRPVSLQDSLAELYGHRLTYVEGYRAFDIGARFPGRMPYWIDKGFTRRTVASVLGDAPVTEGSPGQFSQPAIARKLLGLGATLIANHAYSQAAIALRLAESAGEETGELSRRLNWRKVRHALSATTLPVTFFPTMPRAILDDVLAASPADARDLFEIARKELKAKAGKPG